MPSIIERLSIAQTDATRVKMYRDPVINKGTLFLFDFLDAYCNPAADGAIAAGAVFKNLVPGGPDGVAATAGAAYLANANGKAGLVFGGAGSGAFSGIDLGTAVANIGSDEFIVCTWSKEPTVSPATGFVPILAKQATGNNGLFIVNAGANGNSPFVNLGTSGGGSGVTTGQGAPRHIGAHYKPGQGRIFVNGVLTATVGAPAVMSDYSANPTRFGSSYYKGTIYRGMMEDITVSGASPDAQILADYNRGVARGFV